MNLPKRYEHIFESAARRNLDTRQPSLNEMSDWLVPNLTDPRYEERAAAMMEAFFDYQDVAEEASPEEPADLDEYTTLLAAADALWE